MSREIPFEADAALLSWFRDLLHLPDDAELDASQVVRAVMLAQAEAAVLDATAEVLDRAFLAIADEFGLDDGPAGD